MSILTLMDDNGWQVCKTLAASRWLVRRYYLAGGTALALQLGHRRSYDLDFFQLGTGETIDFERIYRELARLFAVQEIDINFKQVDQATLNICGVKVTFLAYPFTLLEPLVPGHSITPALKGINLAHPREIALMKAYTIGRRPTYRDYIDLYFLLKTGQVTVEYILTNAPRKFTINGETVFSIKLFLEQLVYTDDIQDKDVVLATLLLDKVPGHEVEEFLCACARKGLEWLLNNRNKE